MATRFEMVLHGENPVALRAAADEALHEIERLHAQLNLYSPSSEVSFINARASREAVQVEPRLFALLLAARRIFDETKGAFDITVAPLIRCWGFMQGSGAVPAPDQLAEARAQVGMQHVILDERRSTVRFARSGLMIDLGSIGKGYALEVAAETLEEAGIQNALIHGGSSTVWALGKPLESDCWKVAIDAPPAQGGLDPAQASERPGNANGSDPIAVIPLRNEALSVSAVHGKCFRVEGKTYGHVIDPRTGMPAQGALLAAVVLPSAMETDAISTALLLGGVAGHDQVARLRPAMRTLVVELNQGSGQLRTASQGLVLTRPRVAPEGKR